MAKEPIKKLELTEAPICPLCKQKMVVVEYKGYYESFCYWACNCEDEQLKPYINREWRGSYN